MTSSPGYAALDHWIYMTQFLDACRSITFSASDNTTHTQTAFAEDFRIVFQVMGLAGNTCSIFFHIRRNGINGAA